MSDQRLKIAVFIDFDNVEIGVKTTLGRQFDVGAVLEAIKERGEIITKIAYGDWKRAGDYGRTMSQHAVRLVQRVMTPGGDKNGADINLALDALEMAFTHAHINAFVIVGGDSDFITLVEKLKQYDRKVFVVGGRAFSSQVMQKNCTEFIAYENIAGVGGGVPAAGRQSGAARAERGRLAGASLEQALPLVKRALKVLNDREVSPQLGLLKSTLLQLDSSFSERDYGSSTFRDFAEKLEQRGYVTLKHSGRTTIVELTDAGTNAEDIAAPSSDAAPKALEADAAPARTEGRTPAPEFSLADGVALVRAVLAEATTPPRWPMYLRQMKQFIRAARPDFDERRYGSLPELLRACQKDGLLRLERDRQGGLRAFAGAPRPSTVPHGWASLEESSTGELIDSTEAGFASAGPLEEQPAESSPKSAAEAASESEGDDQLAIFGAVSPSDPEPKPRARRGLAGAAAATKPKRARPAARTKNDEATKSSGKERRPKSANEGRPARARTTRARRTPAGS
jgi:uncharacterized LabA/DUF88 family protein